MDVKWAVQYDSNRSIAYNAEYAGSKLQVVNGPANSWTWYVISSEFNQRSGAERYLQVAMAKAELVAESLQGELNEND